MIHVQTELKHKVTIFFVLLFAVTYYSSIFADYNKLNLIGDCSLVERAIDLKNSEQICLSLV